MLPQQHCPSRPDVLLRFSSLPKSDITGCLRCRTDCQHPLAWCALELRLTIQTPRCPPFAAAGMGVLYKSSLMDVFGLQNVVNQFMQVASDHRCSFLGNVTVGRDVPLATLQQMYHAVRRSCHFTICLCPCVTLLPGSTSICITLWRGECLNVIDTQLKVTVC